MKNVLGKFWSVSLDLIIIANAQDNPLITCAKGHSLSGDSPSDHLSCLPAVQMISVTL